jgi:hypothetical protein
VNPLEQLRDLHTPPPPGFWPPAPGWWLIAVLLVLMAGLGIFALVRHRRRNRYRRAALAELAEIRAHLDTDPPGDTVARLLALVRRTALTARADTPLRSLPARELLTAIDAIDGGRLAKRTTLEDLVQSQYRSTANIAAGDAGELAKAVDHWIRRHRREQLC